MGGVAQPFDEYYTVDVPGLFDILRVPARETEQTRLARYLRYRNRLSAVPELFEDLPRIINVIDDAQDLLATALLAGKWLAPRALGALVPGLGWAVLAADVANGITRALSYPLTGPAMLGGFRGSKISYFDTMRPLFVNRPAEVLTDNPLAQVRGNAIGFALQAGQVLQDFTGYGLALGPLFGFVSDAVWAAIRGAGRVPIVISVPPPDDPLGKAARFLLQTPILARAFKVVDYNDVAGSMLATDVAWQVIHEAAAERELDWNLDQLLETYWPYWYPSDPATQEFLLQFGYNPLPVRDPFTGEVVPPSTIGQAQAIGRHEMALWWQTMRERFPDEPTAPITLAIAQEAAQGFWDLFMGAPRSVRPGFDALEKVFGMAIEYDVLPWFVVEQALGGSIPCTVIERDEFDYVNCNAWVPATAASIGGGIPYPHWQVPTWSFAAGVIRNEFDLWLRIAVDLYCGRAIRIPYWRARGDQVEVAGEWHNLFRWGRTALSMAMVCVWGNAWTTGRRRGSIDRPPEVRRGFCRRPAGIGNYSGIREGTGLLPPPDVSLSPFAPPLGPDTLAPAPPAS